MSVVIFRAKLDNFWYAVVLLCQTRGCSGVWVVGIAALPERNVDDRRKAHRTQSLNLVFREQILRSNSLANFDKLCIMSTIYNNSMPEIILATPAVEVMAMSHHRTSLGEMWMEFAVQPVVLDVVTLVARMAQVLEQPAIARYLMCVDLYRIQLYSFDLRWSSMIWISSVMSSQPCQRLEADSGSHSKGGFQGCQSMQPCCSESLAGVVKRAGPPK